MTARAPFGAFVIVGREPKRGGDEMFSAETIIEQMGGFGNLRMMMGATFLKDTENQALIMKFKGSRKANVVEIRLNAMDLYDMTFRKMGRNGVVDVEEHNDVYNDQLQEIFTKVTGLYTRLF